MHHDINLRFRLAPDDGEDVQMWLECFLRDMDSFVVDYGWVDEKLARFVKRASWRIKVTRWIQKRIRKWRA